MRFLGRFGGTCVGLRSADVPVASSSHCILYCSQQFYVTRGLLPAAGVPRAVGGRSVVLLQSRRDRRNRMGSRPPQDVRLNLADLLCNVERCNLTESAPGRKPHALLCRTGGLGMRSSRVLTP